MKPIYTIGICQKCFKEKPLKNGFCVDCQEEYNGLELPEFMKDLFNFGEDKNE